MSYRTKIIDIELSQPLETFTDLGSYSGIQGLVRFHGAPLGTVYLPVNNGCCAASAIAQAILPYYNWAISRQLVLHRLGYPEYQSWNVADLLHLSSPDSACALPTVTVAFCPRQITDLTPCLDALQQLDDPQLEILVIEAAPQTDELQQLVNQRYSHLQYIATAQPGLNAARNCAIDKAQGEILAFTDERGIVDSAWIKTIATTFAEHPAVMAMTGLVVPVEIETEAQGRFETSYGLGRGCERRWYVQEPHQLIDWPMLGTMQMGSGVNMAYRRSLFEHIGQFDLQFDLTFDQATMSDGGDWEMFCRVLLSGHMLLYEPSAIVRYRACRDYEQLRQQIRQDIVAFYTYLTVGISQYPDQWFNFVCLGLWKLARLILALLRPGATPRNLTWAELEGVWQWATQGKYKKYKQRDTNQDNQHQLTKRENPDRQNPDRNTAVAAVRTVDLTQPLPDLTDIGNYKAVRVFVTLGQMAVGQIDIEHYYQPVSAARLRQAIADQLFLDLLALPHGYNRDAAWTHLESVFIRHWTPATVLAMPTAPPPLPEHISVSIVITTCDRPTDLANCLRHLRAQQTNRRVEIIVADNRPASGLTAPVVAEFAAKSTSVKLVQEPRPGGSYGRNAAIVASTGDIIVTVDDDVTVPPDWLEKLIAPLARPEVMVVTGNVLPLELETPAQMMFETLKGGLGEGFKPFEVDRNWWASFQRNSPPVWDLGVSANAAFRATIFSHPEIGLMDEVLGPGTPTVGGEENHLIYKVLRAGYKLVYEPAAYVWHKHRRDLPALYRQVYGHMKGGTAYHLLLWIQEKDLRGLRQLIYELPNYYFWHIVARIKGKHQTPWRFLWSEIAGYFAGYWGYWQSWQLVKRQGRSAPYIPVAQRLPDPAKLMPPELPVLELPNLELSHSERLDSEIVDSERLDPEILDPELVNLELSNQPTPLN